MILKTLKKHEYEVLKALIITKPNQIYNAKPVRVYKDKVKEYVYPLESFVHPDYNNVNKHVYINLDDFITAIEGLNNKQVKNAVENYFTGQPSNLSKCLGKLKTKGYLKRKTVYYKDAKKPAFIWVIMDTPRTLLAIFNEFKRRNELKILLKSCFYNKQTFMSDYLLTIDSTTNFPKQMRTKLDTISEEKAKIKKKNAKPVTDTTLLYELMLPPSFIINSINMLKEQRTVTKLRQFYYTKITTKLLSMLKYMYISDITNEEYKDLQSDLKKDYDKIKDYY